jgi:hypothetical protein
MQLHAAIFFAAQSATTVYAVRWGGSPERVVAAALAVAAIVSTVVPLDPAYAYATVNWRLFWIDVGLLMTLVAIALAANRYWPMWLAALQLDTVMTHAVKAYDPQIWALVYSRLTGLSAYPIMAVLLIGTIRHHRRGQAGAREAGWVAILPGERSDA